MTNRMTYEEALVKVRGYLTSYLPLDDEGEIDEIMQALDQESVLNKIKEEIRDNTYYIEDCISREAVLDELDKYIDKAQSIGTKDDFISFQELVVKSLSSVKPQPKIGHWIEVTNGRGGHECDLCHEYAPSYQSGDEYLTKYCPNCGAKMEVEK